MKLFAVVLAVPLAAALCQHGTTLSPRADGLFKRDGTSFGYLGLHGPMNWHALDPLNRICAEGRNQSPINIDAEVDITDGSSLDLQIDSYSEGAVVENLGTTVVVYVNGSALFRGERYNLKQYHFHTPSEHTWDGQQFLAEVHFVFQAADEKIAVIAWFLEIAHFLDKASKPMRVTLRSVRHLRNPNQSTKTTELNFGQLISDLGRQRVAQYNGSLTTPPCSENVIFNVVEKPLFVGSGPYRLLKRAIGANARFTQNRLGDENLLVNAAKELDRINGRNCTFASRTP